VPSGHPDRDALQRSEATQPFVVSEKNGVWGAANCVAGGDYDVSPEAFAHAFVTVES
jgi:hypothetical protein